MYKVFPMSKHLPTALPKELFVGLTNTRSLSKGHQWAETAPDVHISLFDREFPLQLETAIITKNS